MGQGGGRLCDRETYFTDLELTKEVKKEDKYIEMANERKAEGEDGEWRIEKIEPLR